MDSPIDMTARRTLVILLLVGLALLVVQMSSTLVLIFSAILIATLILAASEPFVMLGIRQSVSVFLGLAAIIVVLTLTSWLFGSQLGAEFANVAAQLPASVDRAKALATTLPFGNSLLSATPDIQNILGQAVSVAFGALGAVLNFVLVLIAAIYLALQPKLYARGLVLLFPKRQSERIGHALNMSGRGLRRYLLAQFVTMTAVGTIVGIGLTIIGVPSAAALGVIVGLANFIPLLGPFIGAVPGVLIALGQGTDTALWAVGVYFVAQQLEGNLLTPLVQRYAVSIPPALLLFALAGLTSLFGIIGAFVAAPLAVVIYTLVSILWVRDTLEHDIESPLNS